MTESTNNLSIVKVGGSLFAWPKLGERLDDWLASHAGRVLLFPGGGALVDGIRRLDDRHRLGEETSHWLALSALTVHARLLASLLDLLVIEDPRRWLDPGDARAVLDPFPWAAADEFEPGHCPHNWGVTSDSLALRLAQTVAAESLVLLKSTNLPSGLSWAKAAQRGLVDRFFPRLASSCPGVAIRWVNLRRRRWRSRQQFAKVARPVQPRARRARQG